MAVKFVKDGVDISLLETLHKASEQLLLVKEEYEIYEIMSQAIKQMLPGVFFLVAKIMPDNMNFRILDSYGFEKYLNRIKKILNKDPYQIDFPFKNLTKKQLHSFESRKIHCFPGGIYDIVNGSINKTVCKSIEKLLGISEVYGISFYVEKKYFGGISFFIPKSVMNTEIMNRDTKTAIETLSNLASSLIQKLQYQHELINKNENIAVGYARLKVLISSLNDLVWIAKGDGSEIEDLNNSFKKFYGIAQEELQDNPTFWIDYVHSDDIEIVRKSSVGLFEHGKAHAEYRIVRPNTEITWISDRKSIVYDSDGRAIVMGGVAIDITEQKSMIEELEIKNYALEVSPVAIGLSDLNGILFFANNAFIQLWGYKNKSEVIGKHVSEFASSSEQVSSVLKTIGEGKVYLGEGQTKRKDGSIFYTVISATLVKHEGIPKYLLAIFTDITERKLMEVKLREINQMKDQLFSIIAHDLTSPFNSILGLTEVLANNYTEIAEEDRLIYINLLNNSATNIYKLLENLLEWSKLQQGNIEIQKERFGLKRLVDECCTLYLAIAENKKIAVVNNVSVDTVLIMDSYSIKTIIRNLLNNALKYTPNGGVVIFSSIEYKDSIDITLKDTGIGIKPESITKLFNIETNKSTPGTNNEKGTGLGLVLCKELAEKNGGRIWVESELGKGSVFHVIFPANYTPDFL